MHASIVVAVLVGLTASVTADTASVAAVEKVVRANIEAAFTSHGKLDATTTKGVQFHPAADENDSPWFDGKCGERYCNDGVFVFGKSPAVTKQKIAPYKLSIVVDDAKNVGWFFTELKVAATLLEGDAKPLATKGTWPIRVNGIVVKEGDTWKVAAEKFSFALSDAKLVQTDDWIPNYGELKGTVETEIAAWFPKGLAAKQSTRATIVNGTAPGEVARDKAKLGKLVKAWDRLALSTEAVDWTPLANGAIGWAHVTVTMPLKNEKKKIMSVGIVAVPEEGGWRWVSLNWSPDTYGSGAAH
jgi:hypothetical protein